MAFEEKSRPQPAGKQAPVPDVFRQMLETMVQETIRAEFERIPLGAVETLAAARIRSTHPSGHT